MTIKSRAALSQLKSQNSAAAKVSSRALAVLGVQGSKITRID
jgi:hypothetical protein